MYEVRCTAGKVREDADMDDTLSSHGPRGTGEKLGSNIRAPLSDRAISHSIDHFYQPSRAASPPWSRGRRDGMLGASVWKPE